MMEIINVELIDTFDAAHEVLGDTDDGVADVVMIMDVVYRISLGALFFFQAEDGIRDLTVTGVQTCALPISRHEVERYARAQDLFVMVGVERARDAARVRGLVEGGVFETDRKGLAAAGEVAREIGRASCRERV